MEFKFVNSFINLIVFARPPQYCRQALLFLRVVRTFVNTRVSVNFKQTRLNNDR